MNFKSVKSKILNLKGTKLKILLGIIVIFIIYLVYKKYKFLLKKQKEEPLYIRSFHDSKKSLFFNNKSIPVSSNMAYSISLWLYIDSWKYKYGEKKHIMHIGDERSYNVQPLIYFDKIKNNIIIETDLKNNKLIHKIEDIPLKKWVNLIIVVDNQSLRIFNNGKLDKILVLNSYIKENNGHVYICNNGGYSGLITQLKYYNKAISLNTISSIYKSGPKPWILPNLGKSLSNYKNKISNLSNFKLEYDE